MGEKPADFSACHPKDMANGMLWTRHMVCLVEKAPKQVDSQEHEKSPQKNKKADCDLNDFPASMLHFLIPYAAMNNFIILAYGRRSTPAPLATLMRPQVLIIDSRVPSWIVTDCMIASVLFGFSPSESDVGIFYIPGSILINIYHMHIDK
jgi:hypothetical protein